MVSINKYVSNSGYCSRREADKLIEQERVTINDELAFATSKVKPNDVVAVDFEIIKIKPNEKKVVFIAFNKPKGITCTTNESDPTNIISYIKFPKRIFPIGRLDKNSDGLIFLTNDGDIVNKILRAGNNHEKEYYVTVNQAITPDFLKKMSNGVKIEGGITKKCTLVQDSNKRFRITLVQGLNRQIRLMCEALGYAVTTLTRIRIMNIELGNIPGGKYRLLSKTEIETIYKLAGQSSKTEEASLDIFKLKKKKVPTEFIPKRKPSENKNSKLDFEKISYDQQNKLFSNANQTEEKKEKKGFGKSKRFDGNKPKKNAVNEENIKKESKAVPRKNVAKAYKPTSKPTGKPASKASSKPPIKHSAKKPSKAAKPKRK